MKAILFALTIATALQATAASELACWNIFSERGSKPVMVAKIGPENVLELGLNPKAEVFVDYTSLESRCFENSCYTNKSTFTPRFSAVTPSLIDSKRRETYLGNNSYRLGIATWSRDFINKNEPSKSHHDEGVLQAELILPVDLSPAFLQNYRIRGPKERSNAVMILTPPMTSNQSGSVYLRMFCVSK